MGEVLLSNYQAVLPEAGCDEAGRGCLAGPVVAAAVIFPEGYVNAELNDSKQLNAGVRAHLKEVIQQDALAYAIAFVDEKTIDKVNILNASILAMHLALGQLSIQPAFIIVDGNRFKQYKNVAHQTVVKGDSKYLSIAAASILAKTARDAYMENLHEQFPLYQWRQNKGYATELHRIAIQKYGQTPHHRRSFIVKSQLRLL